MPVVAEFVAYLVCFAPLDLAEEWDNVGLLLGERSRPVTRVLTCLTLTPDVAAEAVAENVSLIVSHHPILFRPVKRITADDPQGKMLVELLAARIAVYSPHTAYDSSAAGINQQLAERLGLTDVTPLRPILEPPRCKIVCFVPRAHVNAVREALWSAGGGVIGDYSRCGFVLDGTGSFLGSDGTHPTIGTAGKLEEVAEARLEVICPEKLVPEAIRRMRAAHPYEEPAYDVYPLKEFSGKRGSGRVGSLSIREPSGDAADSPSAQYPLKPESRILKPLPPSPPASPAPGLRLADLVARVKSQLGVETLQVAGDLDAPVARVGICCGSGGDLLPAAVAAKCDAFLTGEATFHKCLEARSAGVALLLAGHYATERPALGHLATLLGIEFPGIPVVSSRRERDPLQWC